MALAVTAAPAASHPLDEPPIDQHTGVLVTPRAIEVTQVVVISELIAFREIPLMDLDGDYRADPEELPPYAASICSAWAADIAITVAGEDATPNVGNTNAEFERVSSTLGRLTVTCRYEMPWTSKDREPTELTVTNRIRDGWPGWQEVVIAGTGVAVISEAPDLSPTGVLTSAPAPGIEASRTASAEIMVDESARPIARTESSGATASTLGFVDGFVTGERTGIAALVVAMVAAMTLGLIHALAPGHGKTLMAAYLVGTRGTSAEATLLALTVAVSHTAGVAALAGVALWVSRSFRPEVLYPYLALVSAALVTVVGFVLVARARRSGSRHGPEHTGGHGHPHDHSHDPMRAGASVVTSGISWRTLAVLGLSGGLVPSASAVILLLGALSLGRALIGLILVALFGLGMAVALVTVGVLVVRVRDRGFKRLVGRFPDGLVRTVPTVASLAVVLVGVLLIVRAVGLIVS